MRRACVLPWRSLAVPDFMSDPSPSSGALEKAQIPAYAAQLNAPQRDAVLTTEGPVLMLAGAGTGKTAALTARLAHLIATRRAWPSEILCVTFTNKAAREMRERVGRHIGDAVEGMPWLGTFHSIGARMLRRHAELVGLESNYTIIDTDDQLRLLKQLIQENDLDEKRWPARQLAGLSEKESRLVVYRRSAFPDDNLYNTATMATEGRPPALVHLGIEGLLPTLSPGFYYLWPAIAH